MRKILLLISVNLLYQFGISQIRETNDFFYQIAYEENVSIMDVNVGDSIITTIYYEFSYSNKNSNLGEGCIFAVPKNYSNAWVRDAINTPTGKCNKKTRKKDVFYKYCSAIQYFADIKELMQRFDIYTFLVREEYLEGPYQEASEGGTVEYFTIKPNSKIEIYKYLNNQWGKIEEQELGNRNPRNFGEIFIKNILTKEVSG